MLEMFLCVLEEELQIEINRKRPAIARMSRIMRKLESLTRDAEHRRGADADQHKRRSRIFSGDYSNDMWHDIDNAKTVEELRRALYFVCCRLQELESRMY